MLSLLAPPVLCCASIPPNLFGGGGGWRLCVSIDAGASVGLICECMCIKLLWDLLCVQPGVPCRREKKKIKTNRLIVLNVGSKMHPVSHTLI